MDGGLWYNTQASRYGQVYLVYVVKSLCMVVCSVLHTSFKFACCSMRAGGLWKGSDSRVDSLKSLYSLARV